MDIKESSIWLHNDIEDTKCFHQYEKHNQMVNTIWEVKIEDGSLARGHGKIIGIVHF